jgi:hypothetical protein
MSNAVLGLSQVMQQRYSTRAEAELSDTRHAADLPFSAATVARRSVETHDSSRSVFRLRPEADRTSKRMHCPSFDPDRPGSRTTACGCRLHGRSTDRPTVADGRPRRETSDSAAGFKTRLETDTPPARFVYGLKQTERRCSCVQLLNAFYVSEI